MDESLRASLETYDAWGYELVLLTPDGMALIHSPDVTVLLEAGGGSTILPPLHGEDIAEGGAGRRPTGGRLGVLALVLIASAAAFLLGFAISGEEVHSLPPASTEPIATPPAGAITSGAISTGDGFGLIVFGGGTSEELVRASGCDRASVTFWTTDQSGRFVPYIPDAPRNLVNAEWHAQFPAGIPPDTPLLGRCW